MRNLMLVPMIGLLLAAAPALAQQQSPNTQSPDTQLAQSDGRYVVYFALGMVAIAVLLCPSMTETPMEPTEP